MYKDFSSLPPEEERLFVPFEQRTMEAEKAASKLGIVGAVGILILTLAIVLGFWGPIKQTGFEEEAAQETPAAAAATPAPAAAPAAPAPAAPAPAAPAPAAPAAPAPAPQ